MYISIYNDIYIYRYIPGWWLLLTPLKNMSSSVGMMTFPIYGKMKNVLKPPSSIGYNEEYRI